MASEGVAVGAGPDGNEQGQAQVWGELTAATDLAKETRARVALVRERVTVGRATGQREGDGRVNLASPSVSWQHVVIDREPEGGEEGVFARLTDTSTNGTYVAGKRLPKGEAVPVYAGDVVGFAGTGKDSNQRHLAYRLGPAGDVKNKARKGADENRVRAAEERREAEEKMRKEAEEALERVKGERERERCGREEAEGELGRARERAERAEGEAQRAREEAQRARDQAGEEAASRARAEERAEQAEEGWRAAWRAQGEAAPRVASLKADFRSLLDTLSRVERDLSSPSPAPPAPPAPPGTDEQAPLPEQSETQPGGDNDFDVE